MRTDGKKFYRVDVEVQQETAQGKYKKHTEQYLVLDTGVAEASNQLITNFIEAGDLREYRVKGVVETKIVEVIH